MEDTYLGMLRSTERTAPNQPLCNGPIRFSLVTSAREVATETSFLDLAALLDPLPNFITERGLLVLDSYSTARLRGGGSRS